MKTVGEYNDTIIQAEEIRVVGEITEIEIIAIGNSLRNLDT
jgi:hypothetical protein